MFKERRYGSRLVRLLNVYFDMGVVPMNWPCGCIVTLYKGKSDKYECSNSKVAVEYIWHALWYSN